jgi:Tol biopolymer transport system component
MLFEEGNGIQSGGWRVDVLTGEQSYISSGYGIPAEAGVIAVPDRELEQIALLDSDGTVRTVVNGQGIAAWPSPDGSRLAWLERLPISIPSSSVNRSVRLHVANLTANGVTRPIVDLQAQHVTWLPDNRHLMVNARNLEFEDAGIWMIDVETAEVEILFEELFVRAVRLAPDGRSIALMRVFNSDPSENGVWVMDIESRTLTRLFESGSYRWDADSAHLWRLAMIGTEQGNDWIERVDIQTGEVTAKVELDGQVLNEEWEISPDGSLISFWRYGDGNIVVQSVN